MAEKEYFVMDYGEPLFDNGELEAFMKTERYQEICKYIDERLAEEFPDLFGKK